MSGKVALRAVVLGYLGILLAFPLGILAWRAFGNGFGAFFDAITAPDAISALKLTLIVTAIAVPLNTVFGVAAAVVLVRQRFWGRGIMNALIDLPFAMSPVVIGLALLLLFGRDGWAGGWLQSHDIHVVFAVPGIVLATVLVSLPFVVREVAPLLAELGTEQEEAAGTLGSSGWQTFRRITLPGLRVGIAYGVVLTTARSLGEFGAVSVVSGHLAGKTETLPLYVQDRVDSFDQTGAYASAVVLALLAVAALVAMRLSDPREARR